MRIALFHNLQSGGGKRALHELSRGLKSRGHRLDLYVLSSADEGFLPLAPHVERARTFQVELPMPGRLGRLMPYSRLALSVRLFSALDRVSRQVAQAIDGGAYDLAFVHECRFAVAPHLLRHLRTPSALFCAEPKRGLYQHARLESRPYAKEGRARGGPLSVYRSTADVLASWYLRREERRSARAATMMLTCSDYSRELLWRSYGAFARTSYLGVDTERFRPVGVEKENMVVSVGELVPRKGHDFVIRALARLEPAAMPRLVVAANGGWDDERAYLRELAAQLEVDLEIRENLGDADLVDLYNRAMVLACAAVMEPFGLVALEAMSCGTPVVAVREAGFRESVVDGVTGYLTPRDEAEFAERLRAVLTGDGTSELGREARSHVEKSWTWTHAEARLDGHLGALLAKSGSRPE